MTQTLSKPRRAIANRQPAATVREHGGSATGNSPGGGKSVGQLVRDTNRWRDQYNPLRSLVIARVVAMLEAAERGDYAELQLTMRKLEKRYPVLKGLKSRIHAAIEKLDWNIKVVEPLPEGANEAQAEAQQVYLRSRYDLIENLTEAIGFLATPEFRGYAILQKHRFNAADSSSSSSSSSNDGAVRELHWLPHDQFSRAGCFGDFFYNKDSRFGVGGDGCAAALGEENRISSSPSSSSSSSSSNLPREDFIIREEESPLYEIALIAFVNWAMGRKDWAAFTEIFGLPKGVVIMPANIPNGKELEYQVAAEKVSDGVAGALPATSDIKFPTSSFKDNGPFKDFCAAQDADVVLAGTGGRLSMLTADKGGLGDGPSEEHADAFDDIAQAIARRINQTMQRDFDRLELAAEFPGQPVLAYFELCAVEQEDATEVITQITGLKSAGYNVSKEQVEEKTGYELDEMDQSKVQSPKSKVGEEELDAKGNPIQNRAPGTLDVGPGTLDFAAAVAAKLDPVASLLNRITEIKDDAQMMAMLQNFLTRADSLAALVTADVTRQAAALEQITAPALVAGLTGKQL